MLGIIRKDNNPIYLKPFVAVEEEDPLKFHYIAHTALDIIEEKVQTRKNTATAGEMYLGLLYPTEVYKIYGYITNSKTKFIFVTDEAEVKDVDVKSLLTKLHYIYAETICNPFYKMDQKIDSKTFHAQVERLLLQFK